MAKRSRKRPDVRASSMTPNPAPTSDGTADTPIASLVARIGSGQLDADLPVLIDAINARVRIVADLRTRQALVAQLSVGTRVRLNHTVSPRYLHGCHGEVHDIDGDHVVVCLDVPVGRFTSGHVRCSALALERTGPTGT